MVSDLKTFAHKGCKIAAQKKVSFSANFALLAGIGANICIGREMLCLPYAGFFFDIIILSWLYRKGEETFVVVQA